MILVFSDIHADKKSAKFIEWISKGYSEVICCGDICGFGRDFKYCIDMFRSRGIKNVLGNHDYLVLHKESSLSEIADNVADPIKWTRNKIKQKELDYLASLPIQLETSSGIFVKHTVNMHDYARTDADCKPLLSLTESKVIFIGHTHVMKEHKLGDVTVINAGSITKGREGTSAGYIIYDKSMVSMKERGNRL